MPSRRSSPTMAVALTFPDACHTGSVAAGGMFEARRIIRPPTGWAGSVRRHQRPGRAPAGRGAGGAKHRSGCHRDIERVLAHFLHNAAANLFVRFDDREPGGADFVAELAEDVAD